MATGKDDMAQKKILIVDDEKIILHSLSADLSHHGYDVDTADNGEEGIKKLTDNQYNLLISDLIMEGMGGIELLRKAREINKDMAVCLLTGYADLTSAINALRLGADDYLVKPCEPEELLFRVKRALAREELRSKIRYYENILPVCAVCKKIRDDSGKEPGSGDWLSLDQFLKRKTGVKMKSVRCKDCAE